MDASRTAESNPSPKSSWIIRIIEKLFTVLRRAARRASRFNDSLATLFHMSAQWLAGAEIAAILTAGFTMIGVTEYAAAVFCWVLLALIVVAKIVDSNLTEGRKTGLAILSVLVSVLLITWTNIKRGEADWSALSAPIHRLLYVNRIGDQLVSRYHPIPPSVPSFWSNKTVPHPPKNKTAAMVKHPQPDIPPLHKTESFLTYVLHSESDSKYPVVCPMSGEARLRLESCGNIAQVASHNLQNKQKQFIVPSIAAIIQHYLISLMAISGHDSGENSTGPGSNALHLSLLPAIDVPDPESHSVEDLLAITESDRQLFPKELSLSSKVTLPKNSTMSFVHIPVGENPESFVLQIERPTYYKLSFDVHIYNVSSEGLRPDGYEVSPYVDRKLVTYTFSVKMDYIIERKVDPEFVYTDYEDWAKALFESMRPRLEN